MAKSSRRRKQAATARIVTSLDFSFLDSGAKQRGDEPSCVQARILSMFCRTLVRRAVQDIYIVHSGGASPSRILEELPSYLRSRIHFTDRRRRVCREVLKLVYPVFRELEWLLKKGKVDRDELPFGHFHDLCILDNDLQVLRHAVRLEAEADIELASTRKCVRNLRAFVTGKENISLLDRLEGVFAPYRRVNGVAILASRARTSLPQVLLEELLEDARMKRLSESRYLLGVPGQLGHALLSVKNWVREILRDRRAQRYLKMLKQAVHATGKATGVPAQIPEFGLRETGIYCPSLCPLDTEKPNCLRLPRKRPEERACHPDEARKKGRKRRQRT